MSLGQLLPILDKTRDKPEYDSRADLDKPSDCAAYWLRELSNGYQGKLIDVFLRSIGVSREDYQEVCVNAGCDGKNRECCSCYKSMEGLRPDQKEFLFGFRRNSHDLGEVALQRGLGVDVFDVMNVDGVGVYDLDDYDQGDEEKISYEDDFEGFFDEGADILAMDLSPDFVREQMQYRIRSIQERLDKLNWHIEQSRRPGIHILRKRDELELRLEQEILRAHDNVRV